MTEHWQPIETAPKDGARILVWDARVDAPQYASVCIVRWGRDEPFGDKDTWTTDSEGPGYSSEIGDASHWMPLPRSPHAQGETNG